MAETKICIKCKTECEVEKFVRYKNGKGEFSYKNTCKKCVYAKNSENFKKWRSTEKGIISRRKSEEKYINKKKAIKSLERENKAKIKLEKEKLREIRKIELEEKRKIKETKKIKWEKLKRYRATEEYKNMMKQKRNDRWKNKWENNELFALKVRLRNLIRNSFRKKGYKKFSERTEEIVGLDYNKFKEYIESKFLDGMTWDNRGEWHLDHIIPLCTAKNEEELIKLNHYTNLQPLWGLDNLKKGDKVL